MTLEILTSPALDPFKHGFFTRRGGASSGVFAGLNCARGSSDQDEMVSINRNRVADAMGVTPTHLVGVRQVHSADVIPIDSPPFPRPKADALVTATPGLAISVLTADCAPVLFADHRAGVIGAAHAGWRGALDGVLEATIGAMKERGAVANRITAIIGPTISQRAYEVGPEFFERFLLEDQENGRFFSGGAEDRMHFDLPAFILHRLRQAGVAQAEWTRYCTYSDEARFFSFRRSVHRKEADYGRLIAAIRL